MDESTRNILQIAIIVGMFCVFFLNRRIEKNEDETREIKRRINDLEKDIERRK